ncbi:MAG: hypothetical protein IKL82_05690 [Clostridia bacterium]|nr:hypothetical protein [Clostridia bacterium]
MRTREESLNNFCKTVDELISSKYLFANSKIFEIIANVNSSKLLTDAFSYFTDGYDFQSAIKYAFVTENGVKTFVLPVKNTEVLAFCYSLLREITYSNIQLTDVLQFFGGEGNFEIAYKNFAQNLLVPFKSYTYQIGIQMINSTQSREEAAVTQKPVQEEPLAKKEVHAEPKKITGLDNSITMLVRLLDLERLAVTESKLSKEDTQEILYVIDLFEKKIREKDSEKIMLAYLAYLYATKNVKKLKSNVKDITEILIELKII